jgi:hypothetical protein
MAAVTTSRAFGIPAASSQPHQYRGRHAVHRHPLLQSARRRTTGTIQWVSLNRFAPVTIEIAAPDLPAAAEILREYLSEMISRYYGRPTDDAEINEHVRAGHGSDDLVAPAGVLLLARSGDGAARRPVGCVGLRRIDEQTRELTRMFVRRTTCPRSRRVGNPAQYAQ